MTAISRQPSAVSSRRSAVGCHLAAIGIALALLVAGPGYANAQPGHTHQPPAAHEQLAPSPAATGHADHAAHEAADAQDLPPHIPPLTDEDRAAAFPDLDVHMMHGESLHAFVLFDRLEWREGGAGLWDAKGWVGGDLNRLWFRSEGMVDDGVLEKAEAQILYGRAVARWWDLVAGLRQDVRPGPQRTWAAVGVQGLAPYFFEVEATAYVGASGRTLFAFEAEYHLLLTNRLMLQPVFDVQIAGKADAERRIGAGLSSTEAGLRLRYEIRRELAPYVGLVWHWKHFGTADAARAAGGRVSGARFVIGLRMWR